MAAAILIVLVPPAYQAAGSVQEFVTTMKEGKDRFLENVERITNWLTQRKGIFREEAEEIIAESENKFDAILEKLMSIEASQRPTDSSTEPGTVFPEKTVDCSSGTCRPVSGTNQSHQRIYYQQNWRPFGGLFR